ncbi:uncharacterized protein [Drosophila tropicalis]|uniref:uncharacterized protein n=1 Tax=Drosophila tropicalis TaxID=46794 RepID=UPI0035ABA65F
MARKDDPVFNVKFVQLVESQPCLWNYTHSGYSKKEEVQKAWQQVANEIKDTVRNCRERWRTIRSSFLRSLKLARTQTGRGKRKYYLSKYLQFLIPYTKSRSCHKPAMGTATAGGMRLRKPSTSSASIMGTLGATQPMTRIGHMRLLEHHQQQQQQQQNGTKENDTGGAGGDGADESDLALPLDVHVSEEEGESEQRREDPDEVTEVNKSVQSMSTVTACLPMPLRLQTIKVEQQQPQQQQPQTEKIVAHQSLVTLPVTMAAAAAALGNQMDWVEIADWLKCGTGGSHNPHHTNAKHIQKISTSSPSLSVNPALPVTASVDSSPPTVVSAASAPDADYSFLISLHPYLKEMNGKQNRRFRQKVVGLIDNILDNMDV